MRRNEIAERRTEARSVCHPKCSSDEINDRIDPAGPSDTKLDRTLIIDI